MELVVELPDNKVEFFMELMQHLGFKVVLKEPSSETHLAVSDEGSGESSSK
jgi:hypothetical protein